jgi:signal transduction histidine kinase
MEDAPALRAAFEAETLAQWRRGARLACLLGLCFVPAFALQDLWEEAATLRFLLDLRLATVATLAVLLLALKTSIGVRHPRAIALAAAAAVGLMVDVMVLETGGGASPRWAGLVMVSLAGALVVPCTVWMVVAGTVALTGTYVALIVASGRIGPAPPVFLSHLCYLLGTGGIVAIAAHRRERLRWREFRGRRALADALRLQGEFTAKLSHEIRTPINVMIGYADILLDGGLERGRDEPRELTERIRGSGLRLRQLIGDLLDFAKARAGKLEVHAEPVLPGRIVEELADTFRPIAERKGLELRTVERRDLPPVVSDGQRISQILVNLIANAVKFTERGRITIEVAPARDYDEATLAGFAFLDARADWQSECPGVPDGIVVFVHDTGIGIREADIARLAADYQQIGGAEKYGGTGLGLSIARKLASLLGGRLAVRSHFDAGTTFALFLPKTLDSSATTTHPTAHAA